MHVEAKNFNNLFPFAVQEVQYMLMGMLILMAIHIYALKLMCKMFSNYMKYKMIYYIFILLYFLVKILLNGCS